MSHLFAHTNNHDLETLKEGLRVGREWAETICGQFDYILRTRSVTVEWYDEHANHGFDDEEQMYRYLKEMYDYLFNEGQLPESGY